MLRHERRLLVDSLFIGAALTLLVVAVDGAGLLEHAEDFLYDLRARNCQFFTPRPTDKLVHLDIDDTALDVLGAYPWPRRKIAMIFDEIRLAGPKAVEMDILYSEPQLIQHEPIPGTKDYETIDNDAELAAAMKRLGNVIVPATLEPVQRQTPLYTAMVEELRKDIEQDETTLIERLKARQVKVNEKGVGDPFFLARREAIMQRLAAMKATPQIPFAQVRAQLLPHTPEDVHPGVENVVKEQWEKFLAMREFRLRHSLPRPSGMISPTNMRLQIPPLRKFGEAAAGGAFVDYSKFGSAVIRTLPLLLDEDGRVYPQMGLALACRMLDADMTKMRVEGASLIVPRAGSADVVIPLAPPRLATTGYVYGNLMDIPWFGGRQWETMYDYPAHKANKQHIPLNEVWQACIAREKVRKNNQTIDDAVRGLLWSMDDLTQLDRYNASLPPPEDFAARDKLVEPLLTELGGFYLEAILPRLNDVDLRPRSMRRKDATFIASYQSLYRMRKLNPPLLTELADFRSNLSAMLKGKGVLMGWTATAALADFVPTSLHEKSPGVVVHGVIFNGIMTGEMWRRTPWWVVAVTAMGLGLVTALAVGWLSPVRGLFVAGGLMGAYALVNGVLLFDYGNRIVGLAGPLTTIVVVWSGCTVISSLVEAKERERIRRRFSNYADSRLVDYVMENPDVTFEGESREMTVVFTDLAGFTTLSERLGPKIVPMLNELLGELVPVIREHHEGYINKFIGDGIMFFYNAPRQHPNHAGEAVASVLDMHAKLVEFNVRLSERGLPPLSMRAGLVSGHMIVGDAGGGGRHDYTVLGDAVNLSSRLEAANKQTGTHTLMNARACELLDGKFLYRPIGKIQVVGQEAAGMCYEPIATTAAATEADRDLAEKTRAMVDAFAAGKFEECLAAAERLQPCKLVAVYREMCEQYLRDGRPENFDGRIVLTSK